MTTLEDQARSVFLAALERAPDAWPGFLDDACGGDAALRARVAQLLHDHQALGSIHGAAGAPDATGVTAPVADRPGTVIGPYKLLEEIGEGGFGVVFLAEQTHPVRRKVALKVLKPGMDTRQVVARFEAERQALALMDHPNIARVFDGGATPSGRPYFVMELVRGVPITTYCDQNNLTPRQRLELFVQVCHAVQHAHQKGIIHRDLKPSNVLVTAHDTAPAVKVIDFGVAKALGQELTDKTLFTGLAQMVGTPLYMSPEQAGQSGLDIDTRSDIYSLGVLLYELLTGTTPFTKERFTRAAYDEIRRIIREEEPPKPSTRLSASKDMLPSISAQRQTEPDKLTKLVRGDLDWIAMKCLEKDRARRYETANGLAGDIQRYLSHETVQACPPTAIYRFRKFARRNRVLLAASLAVALAVLLAMIILAVSYARVRRETQAKETALVERGKALLKAKANYEEARKQGELAQQHAKRAEEQRGIAEANEKRAKAQTSLAQRRLYASQMNLAMQSSRLGEWPRVLELLEGQRPTESGEELRGFEWYYLWRLCHGGRRVPIRGHEASVLGLAFAPDGRTLASAGWDGTVRLWDTTTGAERMVLQGHRKGPWEVAYSPDGRLLASSGKETDSLIIWDATTGKPLHTIPHSVDGFAFSPDSKRLAGGVVSGDRIDTTVIWDTTTGAESQRIEAAGHVVGFNADGRSLVTFTGQYSVLSEVHCWDVEHSRLRYRVAVPTTLFSASLSPDGTRFVVATGSGTEVFVSDTGERLAVIPEVGHHGRGLALSHDNKLLAVGMENRRVAVVSWETGQPVFEDVHLNSCWTVAFSPDGKLFASASTGGAIHLRDLAPADEATALAADGGRALVFSADGRRLFVGNSGRTKIIDVAQGREIAQLPQAGVMAISADLRTLAGASGRKVTAWETDSGREIAELPPRDEHGSLGLTLSPDGKLAATHHPWHGVTGVTLWDLSTRRSRTLWPDRGAASAHCAEFSPDGSLLAAGFQFYTVTVWDVASGRAKCEFSMGPGLTNFLSVAWAPDGRTLAAGTDVGYVALWDLRTGVWTRRLAGHALPVRALAFAPDGKTLATGSDDKTIKLWDTVTGQERCTLAGHKAGVTKLRFSPDGTTLASASDDGTLRFWRGSTDGEALARRPDPRPGAPGNTSAFEAHQTALALLHGECVDERDALQAIALANKAIELRPGSANYLRTLAIAHFRAGQWQEAIRALDESEKQSNARLASNRLVRAMSLWKLDRKEEARAQYEAVAEQIDKGLPFDEDTARFRAEAAESLGVATPSPMVALPPSAIIRDKQIADLLRRRAALAERSAAAPKELSERWKLATESYQLAVALRDLDQFSQSEAVCREALQAFRALEAEVSRDLQLDYEIGWASHLISDVLVRSGRFEEAEPPAREALTRFQTLVDVRPDRPEYRDAIAIAYGPLAYLLDGLNKPEEAVQARRDALAAKEAAEPLRSLPQAPALLESARPFAEKRDWKQAAAELNKGFEAQPRSDAFLCYSTALARLLAGDADGYAKLAEGMPVQRSGRWETLDVLRTRLIHPRGADDPAALVRVAQSAYQEAATNWSAQNLGMAHYRAQDFPEALRWMEEAQRLQEWYVFSPALAMAHHQLGHADAAREWLDKANKWFRHVTETSPEPLKVTKEPFWQDWAYFEVMLQEAKALIERQNEN